MIELPWVMKNMQNKLGFNTVFLNFSSHNIMGQMDQLFKNMYGPQLPTIAISKIVQMRNWKAVPKKNNSEILFKKFHFSF